MFALGFSTWEKRQPLETVSGTKRQNAATWRVVHGCSDHLICQLQALHHKNPVREVLAATNGVAPKLRRRELLGPGRAGSKPLDWPAKQNPKRRHNLAWISGWGPWGTLGTRCPLFDSDNTWHVVPYAGVVHFILPLNATIKHVVAHGWIPNRVFVT